MSYCCLSSPFQLDAGPPDKVLRLMPFFTLLNSLADSVAKVGATHGPSTIPLSLSHLLFPPNAHSSTTVGDVVSNLASSNTKSLQYLLRSSPSLVVLSLIYAEMGRALFLLHTFTGLVK